MSRSIDGHRRLIVNRRRPSFNVRRSNFYDFTCPDNSVQELPDRISGWWRPLLAGGMAGAFGGHGLSGCPELSDLRGDGRLGRGAFALTCGASALTRKGSALTCGASALTILGSALTCRASALTIFTSALTCGTSALTIFTSALTRKCLLQVEYTGPGNFPAAPRRAFPVARSVSG